MANKKESIAQFYERLQTRVGVCVFLLAIAYAIGAAHYFVAPAAEWMPTAHKLLAILAALMVLPVTVRAALLRAKNRAACREPEGFVADVARKAALAGWMATFLFLVLLSALSKTVLAGTPTHTLVHMVLAVLLGSFSIAFFWLNRDVPEDDGFDEELHP